MRGPCSANPADSSACVNPRGSSNSANGLPRVSATTRSSTRSSTGPRSAERSSVHASSLGRPSTTRGGRPANSPSSSEKTVEPRKATDSATSRRAINASACPEARSSHCASSITQTSWRSCAHSANKPNAAKLTRNRSGGSPDDIPNAVSNASACGLGKRSTRPNTGAQTW